MSGELIVAVEYFQREKGIDREILFEAVEQALLQASKKSVGPARDLRIEIDRKTVRIARSPSNWWSKTLSTSTMRSP